MVLGAKQGNAGDDDDGGANTPERALVRLFAVVVLCFFFRSCGVIFYFVRFVSVPFSIALPHTRACVRPPAYTATSYTAPRTEYFAAIKKYIRQTPLPCRNLRAREIRVSKQTQH